MIGPFFICVTYVIGAVSEVAERATSGASVGAVVGGALASAPGGVDVETTGDCTKAVAGAQAARNITKAIMQ